MPDISAIRPTCELAVACKERSSVRAQQQEPPAHWAAEAAAVQSDVRLTNAQPDRWTLVRIVRACAQAPLSQHAASHR